MEKKKLISQILEGLHAAQEIINRSVATLNELLGDYDAGDDLATWKRSQFQLSFSGNAERQFAPIGEDLPKQEKVEEEKGSFDITYEEIKKMSKQMKGKFFTQGLSVCWRRRQTGKNSYSYQVRFQRDGYHISFHEKRKENLRARFLEELEEQTKRRQEERERGVPVTFTRFALYYFENFRKLRVGENTYDSDLRRFKKHIQPYFKETPLRDIIPMDCQKLLKVIQESGKGKTADEVFSLMNGIFNCAVKHHLIPHSPMDMVFHIQHERKHGSALTKEEERRLLEYFKGTPYELPFAIALYTGLRPNEFASARLEGNFIIAVNSKRKHKRTEYKRIPITPMLRPYLVGVETLSFPTAETMRFKIKDVLPNHILYDLRTTFYTRCTECGVADAARNEFVGHSLGALGNAYTDISDEFLLKEGEKLKY